MAGMAPTLALTLALALTLSLTLVLEVCVGGEVQVEVEVEVGQVGTLVHPLLMQPRREHGPHRRRAVHRQPGATRRGRLMVRARRCVAEDGGAGEGCGCADLDGVGRFHTSGSRKY